MVNFLHHIGVLLIFSATVLLIIASVSTPVWNSVYFLSGTSLGQTIKAGNWGLCVDNSCTRSKLGYNLGGLTNILNGDARIGATILQGLTYGLVLNPIAAGLSFVALLLSLSTHFALGVAASVAAFFAFLVTAIALIIDLVLFITARDRLNRLSDTYVTLGNAMWLVTVATILLLISSFLVCCTHHRNRQARSSTVNNNTYNTTSYVADPNYANSPAHSTVPLRNNDHPEMVQKNKWYQRGNKNTNQNYSNGHTNGLGVSGTNNGTYAREGVV